MTLPVDLVSYGTRAPDPLVRTILGLTRSLPANWLGFRASTPFRRMAVHWLGDRPVDTVLWGARMRLYPRHNSCEKNALFTPQTFDVLERRVLAAALDRRIAEGGTFAFVDIGANVGLHTLFVASRGRARARILAAEPQPGIFDRLSFNLRCNPGLDVTIVPAAVGDRDGEIELVIRSDRAGSYVNKADAPTDGAETLRVRCRPLLGILADARVSSIDALKIDIEGAEDLALTPFLRDAPPSLLPRLIIIEDRPDWNVDLYGLLRRHRYAETARSRHNVILQLVPPI